MFMKFWEGRPLDKEIWLDFETDMDPGSIFPLFHHWDIGRFRHYGTYELKELRINVYDMFWRGKPLDNERRWHRFELYECLSSCDMHWISVTDSFIINIWLVKFTTSTKQVVFLLRFVCLFVRSWLVSLPVSTITQNIINKSSWNFW